MDIDLRQAVINNMKGADSATVSSTIADAIQVKKEQLLPGLGVLFEIYWNNISKEEQDKVANLISSKLS
ncbi:MAG TPA: small acid-soluble spore protein SspI [Bacilli bacterium]|nr:small acid-soluble spore protein SspI [Bacilli bacterium]HPT88811.1 small acid-soluble spore protein SspI [Bacilli bacterium]HQA19263.1 small acid-soluble spore protein SspI [Bacilli bacterium]HQD91779.1 small acid-soluble spore protein SspI [Bacilli bacterium]